MSKGAIDKVEQVGNEDETGVDKKLNLVGSSLFDLTEIKMLLKGLKENFDAPAKTVKAQNLLRAKVFLIEVGNKDFETEKEAGAASISKSIVAVFSMLAAAFIGHLLSFDGDQLLAFLPTRTGISKAFGHVKVCVDRALHRLPWLKGKCRFSNDSQKSSRADRVA